MALTLGKLTVKLEADAGGLLSGLAGAAKAVEKFAKQTKEAAANIAGSAGALTALGTAAVAMASTVDLRARNAVDRLRASAALFAVQVADLLLPAMKELSAWFRRAADAVAGLSPELKAQISHWAVVVAQVAAVAKGIQLLMAVIAPLAQALSGLFGLFEGVSITALATGLFEVVAVVGLVIAAVTLLHKAWRLNWGGIQEKTGSVLETIRGWWTDFVNFLGKAYGKLIDGALAWVKAILAGVDVVREATGVGPSAQSVEGWRMAFEGLANDLKKGTFFTDAWKAVADAGQEAFADLMAEFRLLLKDFSVDKAWDAIKDKVRRLFDTGSGGRARAPIDPTYYGVGGQGVFNAQDYRDTGINNSGDPRAAAFFRGVDGVVASLPVLASGTDAAANAVKFFADRAAQAAADLQAKLEGIGQIALGGMTRAMGEVGNLIQAGVEGAKVGGWVGAVVAVFMELLQKTKAVSDFIGKALDFVMKIVEPLGKAVAPIFAALSEILDKLVPIFKLLFDALAPFFDAIAMIISNLSSVFTTIGHLLKSLTPILQVIGKLLQYLSPVIWLIAKAIGLIVNIIITVLNPIIALVMEIAGNHEGAAALMRDIGTSWEDWATKDGPDFTFAANGAAGALNETAAAANAVTAALLNVPEGYKVNEARYRAAIAEGDYSAGGTPSGGGFSLPGDPMAPGSGGGGFGLPGDPMRQPIAGGSSGPWSGTGLPTAVSIDTVVVQAQDPEDFLRQLNARVGRLNGQRYGTPAGAP